MTGMPRGMPTGMTPSPAGERVINRHVALLFRMGERYLNRQLAGSGVTSGTAPLLLELREQGQRQLTTIATAIGVDKAHVTRSVRALENAGYVAVSPGAGGGRSLSVTLTPSGEEVVIRIETAMLAWIDIVSAGVEPKELATVNAVFDRFYTNARAHLEIAPAP